MKLFCIGVLVFFMSFFSGVRAQVNLDSLFGVWNDETKADTNRLKAMHNIAFDHYINYKPDSSFYYAGLQYNFARNKNNKKFMAMALNTQGVSFAIRSEFERALKYYKKSLRIKQSIINNNHEIAKSFNNIGLLYTALGNYERSLEYFEKALKLHKDSISKANYYSNIGNVYTKQRNFEKALISFKKSIEIISNKSPIENLLKQKIINRYAISLLAECSQGWVLFTWS